MRAQISLEYLLVFVLMLFLLLPALAFFTQEFSSTTDRLKENQVLTFANSVVTVAEQVYYTGAPASKRISNRLPEGVESVRVEEGEDADDADELVIEFQAGEGIATIAVSTDIDLQLLSFPTDNNDGLRTVFVEAYLATTPGGIQQPLAVLTFNGRCPASTHFDINQDNQVTCDDVAEVKAICDLSEPPQRPQDEWVSGNTWESCYVADYSGDCTVNDDDFTNLISRTLSGGCAELSILGEDCDVNSCVSTTFCNSANNRCEAFRSVGEVCMPGNSECGSDLICDGKCKIPVGDFTQVCSDNDDCVSGVCESGDNTCKVGVGGTVYWRMLSVVVVLVKMVCVVSC